jgi:DNA-directed RNA polymerase specialized sigma24 family protein
VPIDDFLDTMSDGDEHLVGRPMPGMSAPTAIIESCNRRIDIRRAIQRLSRPDRGIAKQLIAARVSEIASESGIPRSTIYESIRRIRRQLIDSGLAPEPRPIPTDLPSAE